MFAPFVLIVLIFVGVPLVWTVLTGVVLLSIRWAPARQTAWAALAAGVTSFGLLAFLAMLFERMGWVGALPATGAVAPAWAAGVAVLADLAPKRDTDTILRAAGAHAVAPLMWTVAMAVVHLT